MATSGGDVVANHPFWGPEYVGLGAYRVHQWVAGEYVDAVRFSGYVLGVPKIARIQLRFSVDQNTVVASLLAGEAQAAGEGALPDVPDALAEQWSRTNTGFVLQYPRSLRLMEFQQRPELANPRAILDVRVRRAIAHAVDKQAMSDAVYGGQAIFADTPVWSGSAWGDALDNSILTYPLDPRAAEGLMNQAGYRKGADGFYRGADGRISLEGATVTSPSSITELLVLADGLRAGGFDAQQRVIPAAQAQDNEVRATYRSMFISTTNSGESAVGNLVSTQIPSAATRWRGSNRGGWASSDYDRLYGAFTTTLDRGERVGLMRQMLRLFSEELPSVSLFFRGSAWAFVNEVKGPARAAPETNAAWNIHEWEFR
jgi:peptide/nickel transport system substrate-binding protein